MYMPQTAHASDQLTAKQQKTIASLLSAATIKNAAADAGVSVRTLYGWLKEPAFADVYRQARTDAVLHATARLQQVAAAAVAVLVQVMADATNPPAVRLAAAKAILEFALKATETESILARLDVLEGKRL